MKLFLRLLSSAYGSHGGARVVRRCAALATLFIALPPIVFGFSPKVLSQHAYGGSASDWIHEMIRVPDGYVFIGGTQSTDGDLRDRSTFDPYSYSYWVSKIDTSGAVIWHTLIPGSPERSSITVASGGYLMAVTGYNGSDADFRVVRLDSNGVQLWQMSYGGNNTDLVKHVRPTLDGGFIVVGVSQSIDGDVTGHHNPAVMNNDIWVVKIDSFGVMEWEQSLGGASDEDAGTVIVCADSGFLVVGSTHSSDTHGDVTVSFGLGDGWIAKLDARGNKVWTRTIGTTQSEYLTDGVQTTDGKFVLVGSRHDSASPVTYIANAMWAVKVDSAGNVVWDKIWKDATTMDASAVCEIDSGRLVIIGPSVAPGDTVNTDVRGSAISILQIDSAGNLEFQGRLNRAGAYWGSSITFLPEGNLAIAGVLNSAPGNEAGSHGQDDGFIALIAPLTGAHGGNTGGGPERVGEGVSPRGCTSSVYPNPNVGKGTVWLGSQTETNTPTNIVFTSVLGTEVLRAVAPAGAKTVAVDLSLLSSGTTFYKIQQHNRTIESGWFVKN
jgi:hypothetical protein